MRRLEQEAAEVSGDVDFLLTNEWPEAVGALTAPGALSAGANTPGKFLSIYSF